MKLSPFLFFLLLAFQAFAQKKDLTVASFRDPKLYPKIERMEWRKGTDQWLYMDYDNNNCTVQSLKDTTRTILFTLNHIQTALNQAGSTEKLKTLPPIEWISTQECVFGLSSTRWKYHVVDKKAVQLSNFPEDADDIDFANNGYAAYTQDFNLFVGTTQDKQKVSTDGSYTLAYGKAAHRSEFGITKGTFWSNSGNALAFYRMDQTDVTDYPLTVWGSISDTLAKIAKNQPIKYPMAGSKSHYVTVGVYHVQSRKTIYLQTGEPKEQYLTNITWSPDDQSIYVVIVNRGQNHIQVCRYSAQTGALEKVLFEEKQEKYVEPEHGPIFVPGKTDEFLWLSERDGFQHLYRYKTDGSLVGQLTSGSFEIQDILGWDTKTEHVFIMANKDDLIGLQAYKVNLKSKAMTLLTPEKGFHYTTISSDGKYFLTRYSNLETPGQMYIGDCKTGKKIRDLYTAENPLANYHCPKVEVFFIKSTDGTTDLACRMIKPHDFDPNRSYPVFYYLYGGPHAQMIHNAWLGSADLFLMYMASQGYVVFTLDNRGSGGRGLAFEQATFRQLGEIEMEDHLAGVAYLKQQKFINPDKMAVFGWSFGGFMSTSLMLKKPGTFQVGVAGGPVIDWRMYEIMYTERYMDSPQENKEGYQKTSILNYIQNLKGRLLIIHGLMDDTVVPQHTALFIQECIKKGILVDYFPYPQHPHNVRGQDRVHLYKKIEDYVKRNL